MRLHRIFLKRLSKRQKKAIIYRLLFIFFILFSLIIIYTYQVVPALCDSAKAYLGNTVTRELNLAMSEYTEKNIDKSYINVKYSDNGKVSSVSANVNLINSARTQVSKNILAKLRNGEISSVRLPLGCMLDSAFLYAKGPKLTFNVIGSENFVSSVESEFTESGINQTLHRIYLIFTVNLKLNMPTQNVSVPITSKHLIAETIIVGDVPDAYTNISRFFDDISESEIDDINDFGAE